MYQRRDYDKAIELIASGAIVTEPLMSQHFAMDDYLEAYRFLDRQRDEAMKIFIDVS